MSTEHNVEIEHCLSGELRMEFDDQGRLVRAAACTGTLSVDWLAGTARLSNQHGSSSWSAGVSNGTWSYGPWEQSESTPGSLEAFVGNGLRVLRDELMVSAGTEIQALCRTWLSYGTDHHLTVGDMDRDLLKFYVSATSYQQPEELIAFARLIDRARRPDVWEAIVKRIEVFSAKHKRLIRQELGLVPPAKAKSSGKPPVSS